MEKSITFKELSQRWLSVSSLGKTYTYQQNLQSYINHLNNGIGDCKVADVKPAHIDEIIRQLYIENPNTKKPTSKKVLKNIVDCATRIFDYAIENELIYKNPARNKKKVIPKNAPTKIVSAITPEQQQLVIDTEHRAKIAAVIMMFMGLRTGEVLALEWGDIDLVNYKLSVNKRTQRISSNKYIVTEGTKNGKCRYVSIPVNLGAWLKKKKDISNSYLVVPNRNGELQSPTQWRNLWNTYQNEINYSAYCKKCVNAGLIPANKHTPAGIPRVVNTFNAHQLRHTYATLLYISGVDVLTASELLGHSNIEITLKIYTHLDKQFRELNISKFDNYIQSDLDINNI